MALLPWFPFATQRVIDAIVVPLGLHAALRLIETQLLDGKLLNDPSTTLLSSGRKCPCAASGASLLVIPKPVRSIPRLQLNLNLHICVLVCFARAIHFLPILVELQLAVKCLIIFILALPVAFV